MRENYEVIEIAPSELLDTSKKAKTDGFRLVQICAVSTENGYELSYSFAKEYKFVNYRIVTEKETEIKSITEIYGCAALYENEMVELFGVNITGISLDYKKKLYQIDQETPFK